MTMMPPYNLKLRVYSRMPQSRHSDTRSGPSRCNPRRLDANPRQYSRTTAVIYRGNGISVDLQS